MNPGIQERIRMWEHNAPAAMMALKSVEPSGDWSDLVVIIADMRDPIARQLVESFAEKTNFDVGKEEAKVEAKGQIPTGTLVLGTKETAKIFEILEHPAVAAGIAKVPPKGHVRAIVISSGACSLMHPPIVVMPEPAQG